MIIDTSGLLAIILEEKEVKLFVGIVERAPVVRLSVAGYLEASIVLDRSYNQFQRSMLDTFVREPGIHLEPVTVEQIQIARQAYTLFGKGRHKAGLNFGDCFTYALAKVYAEPVLFKGNGFSHTDLESPQDRIH